MSDDLLITNLVSPGLEWSEAIAREALVARLIDLVLTRCA